MIFSFCCPRRFHFWNIFIRRDAIDCRIVRFSLNRRFERPRVRYFKQVDLLHLLNVVRRQYDGCGVTETRPKRKRVIPCFDCGGLFCQIFPHVFDACVRQSGGPLCDVGIRQFGDGVFVHHHLVVGFYSSSLITKLSLLDIA